MFFATPGKIIDIYIDKKNFSFLRKKHLRFEISFGNRTESFDRDEIVSWAKTIDGLTVDTKFGL